MMNASYHARLPEKLAAAEAREADQREAKGIKLQEHVYKNVFKTISNGIKPTRIHLNFSIFISLLQYGQDQKRKKNMYMYNCTKLSHNVLPCLASRAYHEAKTPFIATTSRYNLGYIGRGYDLFKGNPLSDDGVVDQGFRLPIMELPYTHKFTADGTYRIPDNVDVISESRYRPMDGWMGG